MRRVKVMVAVLSMLVGGLRWSLSAHADDVNPPSYAGNDNSIVLFTSDSGAGLAIDGFDVFPGAFPLSDVNCGNGPGQPCLTMSPSGPDTLYEFQLPNFVDPLPVKEVRIQVTYVGDDEPVITEVVGWDPVCPLTTCPGVFLSHVDDSADTPGASYFFEDWRILPNPDHDRFRILAGPNSQVIQVVIDTYSTVPEPATLLLFGGGVCGLLGCAWWRRRRHSTAARA